MGVLTDDSCSPNVPYVATLTMNRIGKPPPPPIIRYQRAMRTCMDDALLLIELLIDVVVTSGCTRLQIMRRAMRDDDHHLFRQTAADIREECVCVWLSLVGLAKVAHLAELEGRYLEVVPYMAADGDRRTAAYEQLANEYLRLENAIKRN